MFYNLFSLTSQVEGVVISMLHNIVVSALYFYNVINIYYSVKHVFNNVIV